MWMSAFRKKKGFHFFIIIWKYSLSNINLIFEYSVLEKTRHRHGYKVHLFLTTHKHTKEAKIITFPKKQKILSTYFLITVTIKYCATFLSTCRTLRTHYLLVRRVRLCVHAWKYIGSLIQILFFPIFIFKYIYYFSIFIL